MTHLLEYDLLRLSTGRFLGGEETAAFRAHVDSCRACADALTETSLLLTKLQRARPLLERFEDLIAARSRVGVVTRPDAEGDFTLRLLSLSALAREAEEIAIDVAAVAHDRLDLALLRLDRLTGRLRSFAVLYAVQEGAKLVHRLPQAALAFARALGERSETFETDVAVRARRPQRPEPSAEEIRCEAALLESQALLKLNRAAEALSLAEYGREAIRGLTGVSFLRAKCDYFQGSAELFLSRYPSATRRLRQAGLVFRREGDRGWEGRALGMRALRAAMRNRLALAVSLFDEALSLLDPTEAPSAYAAALIYRADAQRQRGFLDDAAAGFRTAKEIVEGHDLSTLRLVLSINLAEIDVDTGRYERAIEQLRFARTHAVAAGLEREIRFIDVYVVECWTRLGRAAEAASAVDEIRTRLDSGATPRDEALSELIAFHERGEHRVEVVARVRRHLEAALSNAGLRYERAIGA